MGMDEPIFCPPGDGRAFASTHWSVVLMAGGGETPTSAKALETLCRAYWWPLYLFIRRQGHDAHQAADLTQDFFSQLLSSEALATVRREKGKFRSFLLASLKNMLANEWRRSSRLKRGGGLPMFSLDGEEAERRYQREPAVEGPDDTVFDRAWAETLMNRSLERLRQECDGGAKTPRFDTLKHFLLADREAATFAEAAAELGMTLAAVKGLVHRLRRRFGELIREDIAQTVGTPGEVEVEVRYLLAAFGG